MAARQKAVNDLPAFSETREIDPVAFGNAKEPQDKAALIAN